MTFPCSLLPSKEVSAVSISELLDVFLAHISLGSWLLLPLLQMSVSKCFWDFSWYSPVPTYLSLTLQVCVLGLHLAKELCEVDEDGDYWLQITRKVPVLPTIFAALEISLRIKQNLHFTEASLHLLLTLARTQQVRDAEKWDHIAVLFK